MHLPTTVEPRLGTSQLHTLFGHSGCTWELLHVRKTLLGGGGVCACLCGHSPWGSSPKSLALSCFGRETIGTYDCINVLLPSDAAQLFQSEGIFPRRKIIDSWIAHRNLRNHKCGVFLK